MLSNCSSIAEDDACYYREDIIKAVMIPRIIHYCWFGGNPKPDIVKQCIASWKRFCPDWEIREWNESNFDVNAMPYTKEAYAAKKWAFVSDVARLKVISDYGGIYLDTDIELLSSIEMLRENDAFFAFESNRNINTGLGFGANAQHPAVQAMLDYYDGMHFSVKGKYDMSPCPAKNTEALKRYCPQFARNGESQVYQGMKILSFGEYSAFAKNHSAGSWIDGPVYHRNRVYKQSAIKDWLRKPEHFDVIERLFGRKGEKVYTFCVYDLLECGPMYYVRRLLVKK